MHRPLRLLLLCALLISAPVACTGKNAVTDGSGGPQLGALAQADANHVIRAQDRIPLPDVHGETLDGQALDLASLRGKVVVVNFWASWCAPCREESARLVQVAKDTAPLGVAFVGLNFKDDRSAARRFTQVQGVPYPSLFDQPGVVLTRLHKLVPQSPPNTMILDRSGRVAALFVGAITQNGLTRAVQDVAQEKTPT